MATKQYLDKAGLKEVLEKLKEKFADIEALVFQGSVADVASLPSLSGAGMRAGLLYIIENEDVTTADFIEGAGKTIDPYSEVVTVNVGTAAAPSYKWYVLGNVFTIKDKVGFGTAFPSAPFDGQAFLYLGADQYDYTAVASPAATDDPAVLGWYVSDGAGGYELATDHTPVAGTTYYTRDDVAIKGGIYEWDDTNSKWVNVGGAERMNRITEAEIDDLFSELWP
jgi:hypothetical protein